MKYTFLFIICLDQLQPIFLNSTKLLPLLSFDVFLKIFPILASMQICFYIRRTHNCSMIWGGINYVFINFSLQEKHIKVKSLELSSRLKTFIKIKKWLSAVLIPLIVVLAVHNLFNWLLLTLNPESDVLSIVGINSIFFDELFQLLIIVDVLLLIFSFFNSDAFHIIMRNSGFIISTILIRISFFLLMVFLILFL